MVSTSLTIPSKRAEIPIYSFPKHAREKETTSIYSPHVLILEGILGLYDQRVLDLLDMRVIAFADLRKTG
jgi:uridine kinase